MDKLFIQGKERLYGSIKISGMKNSALPIIFASLLTGGECVISNVPVVSDVYNALKIISDMGAEIRFDNVHTVRINTNNIDPSYLDMSLVSKMRASSYLMGVILALCGRVSMAYPGGCNFGSRPIDEHLRGFEIMGAHCIEEEGYVEITTDKKLKSAEITLDKISVGATINMILASVLTEGTTVICNTAREPHVDDVIFFLNKCGADITRIDSKIIINGVRSLKGAEHRIYSDMIESLTYIACVGVAKGSVILDNAPNESLYGYFKMFESMGIHIKPLGYEKLSVTSSERIYGYNVRTVPYPGFPTDFHPQFSSLLCFTEDGGSVEETIFPGRFAYVNELVKMGARINKNGDVVYISPSDMIGAETDATDLRAGAALVVASLGASGESFINNIGYILRGYEDIVGKLSNVGAIIKII